VSHGEGLEAGARATYSGPPKRVEVLLGCGRLLTQVPGLARSRLEILRLVRALGSRRTLERDQPPGRSAQRGGVPGSPEPRNHGLTRERSSVPLSSVYRHGS
jgi:hypothetical protein